MIKKLLLLLAAALGVILAAASFQSDEMAVTRSRFMPAPPEAVFKVVNDFRLWDAWSPWSKLDPAMKKALEGPAEGVGAVYRWSGNHEVGEGSTRLVESLPNEKICMKLEFIRPFAGGADVDFSFSPEGGGTKVTWAMRSKKPLIGKVMGLFMDCEKMCGGQFDEGLASLAGVVSAGDAKK